MYIYLYFIAYSVEQSIYKHTHLLYEHLLYVRAGHNVEMCTHFVHIKIPYSSTESPALCTGRTHASQSRSADVLHAVRRRRSRCVLRAVWWLCCVPTSCVSATICLGHIIIFTNVGNGGPTLSSTLRGRVTMPKLLYDDDDGVQQRIRPTAIETPKYEFPLYI